MFSWEGTLSRRNSSEFMNHFQVIRIVFLLVLIFIAGIFTGRLTAPKPKYVVIGPAGRVLSAETALLKFKRQFKLTPEQEESLRKLFEEMEGKVAPYPPFSRERLDIFREYVPRVKAILTPDQYEALDRYVEEGEKAFAAGRRRRRIND